MEEVENIHSIPRSALPATPININMAVQQVLIEKGATYTVLDSTDDRQPLKETVYVINGARDIRVGDKIEFTGLRLVRWNPSFQHIDHDSYSKMQTIRNGKPILELPTSYEGELTHLLWEAYEKLVLPNTILKEKKANRN